jgi:REP element-mobilizing transposase RayT
MRSMRTGTKSLRKPPINAHSYCVPAHLITFSCYGHYLPGQEGAIDRNHNVPGTRPPDPKPDLRQHAETSLRQPPFRMNAEQRTLTLDAIREVCDAKCWRLLAAHVRSNHVHTVVDADTAPELIMTTFKSRASLALNQREPAQRGRLRWARHGSTRRLWSPEIIHDAIHYVLEKQGAPMAYHP